MYYTAVSQIWISVFINMLIFDKLTQDMFRVIDGFGGRSTWRLDATKVRPTSVLRCGYRLCYHKTDRNDREDAFVIVCARWLVIRTHWVRTLRRRKPETTTRDRHSANALHRLP